MSKVDRKTSIRLTNCRSCKISISRSTQRNSMQVDLLRGKKCDARGALRSAQHILGAPPPPLATRSIKDVLQAGGSVLHLPGSRAAYRAAGSGRGHGNSGSESSVVGGSGGVRRRRTLLASGLPLQMGRARRSLAQQAKSASTEPRKGPDQARVHQGEKPAPGTGGHQRPKNTILSNQSTFLLFLSLHDRYEA